MSKYILVVDDNPSDLLMSSVHVEKEGYVAVKASDGFQAIEKLNEYPFQLLIVDLQMPKMGGIELIKRVRRLDNYKSVPILVTSARQESTDVKVAVQAGANDYLVKPLDTQIFEEKFRKLVGKTEEWQEYTIAADSEFSRGYVKRELKISSVSEVGLTFDSLTPWNEGDTIELAAEVLTGIGVDLVLGRVVSCKNISGKFKVKISFVGMTEEIRKKIRLLCRKLWDQAKNGGA